MASTPTPAGSVAVEVVADLSKLVTGIAEAQTVTKQGATQMASDLTKVETGASKTSQAVDRLGTSQARAAKDGAGLARSQDGVAQSTERSGAAAEKAAAQWARYSAMAAQQQKAFQVQERLNEQFRAFSAQGAVQARTLGAVEAAHVSSTKAAGLHAGAWQNLSFQANDAITMLASGSSVFQVIATQSGQVYQALDGPRGVSGGLKEVGNSLLGILTPARIAIGGLMAIGVAGIAAAISWQNTQSEVREALSGVGRAAGVTAGELEGIAVASASASNTSVSAARSLALELAKTGKIARDNLGPIAALGKNFGATLGLDAAQGNVVLARSFAEPGKGAEDLARRYGLLSDATVQYIRHLDDSNERGRAQQALMDALRPKLINAAELTTGWAYAWDKVTAAARNAWEWMGKTVDRAVGGTGGGTDEEIRAMLEERLRYLQSSTARAAGSRGGDLEAGRQAIAQAQRELDAFMARQAKARADAQDVAKNDLSLRAGLIARASAPEVQALDELIAKRKTLNDAIASQGAGPGMKDQAVALARLDAQIRDYTQAGGALELQERKRAEASKITTDALKARTPEEVGAIAARKALNDAEGTAAFQAERTATAERARTEAIAGARKAIDDQSESLTRSAAGENRVAAAWRSSNEALAMRAEASKKAADDVARGLPAQEAEARQAEYLRERLANLKRERAQATAEMSRQTEAQVAVNRQVDQGKITVERASEALQREVEIRRLTAQAAAAEGQDRIDLLRQVDELSGAYQRQAAAKSEAAAQGLLADQDRSLAQLRLEADLVGKTVGERERALAVLRATQELQRQGIALTSEKGRRYIDGQVLEADIRTAKTQYERLAQDISSVVSGIFDDMFKAGNKGMAGFFDSFARGFSRIGTRMLEQNLIAPLLGGQGGFAGGTNPFDAIGKLFDTDGIEKAVNKGSQGGIFDAFSTWLKPAQGADGKAAGGFATSKLGSGLMSAGVGASIGYQSQSPLMGAIGGAASGYAMGGPVGGVVGGIAGLLGGIFGKSQAKKEAEKKIREQLEAYKEAYRQAQPEIEKLRATFRGESIGNVGGSIDAAFQQAYQANVTASKAGDQATADLIMVEFVQYADRLRWQFIRAFEGTLAEVSSGLGTSGPFAQAAAAVTALGENLKAFVADAQKLPEAESNAARARAAAQEAALASLDVAPTLSETQQRLRQIQGTAAGLTQVLIDLGMSAESAATAIAQRTQKALDALRDSFNADLDRKIDDASGREYVNEVRDLVKEIGTLRADQSAVGGDANRVEIYFEAAAQKIVDGAELTGDAFNALVTQFPELTGRVREFTAEVDQAAAAAAAASRSLDYQNRLFAAQNDTTTLAGQLAAYDRQAQQEREQEIKEGGQALADLEAAQFAERLKILRDYQKQAAEAERQRMEAATQAFNTFARGIKEYLDGLRAGPSSNLSPADRLAAARGQFDAQLQAARAGDRDALNGITGYASTLLDASRAYNASSQAYQADLQRVTDALAVLPKQVSAEQFIVDAIDDSKEAVVAATQVMQETLRTAVAANNPAAVAAALNANFDKLDTSVNGLLDFNEFLAGLGPLATKAEQEAAKVIFNAIDTNGDGQISRLEVANANLGAAVSSIDWNNIHTINAAIEAAAHANVLRAAINANSPSLVAAALDASFARLDTSVNGLLDYSEFVAGLGPMATKAEQEAARQIFNQIDANGDGQIDKLELVHARTAGVEQQTGAAIPIQQDSAATLRAINEVSSLQRSQLEALNNQFAFSPFFAPNGVRLDSNLVTALNKIVFNTANTVIGQKSGASYTFARGGFVSGPGTGTSDSIDARLSNGEFVVTAEATRRYGRSMLDAMNDNRLQAPVMPVPVAVGGGQGDAALLAAVLALRTEVAALRAEVRENTDVAEQGHTATTDAVKQNTAAVDDGNRTAARQALKRSAA